MKRDKKTEAQNGSAISKSIVQAPQLLSRADAIYVDAERRFNHEGRVVVAVQVREDASIGEVYVQESSGWLGLDRSALESVRRYRFSPALAQDGKPVSSFSMVAINFRLQELAETSSKELDLMAIENLMVSIRVYERFSRRALSACKGAGFNVGKAEGLLERQIRSIQPQVDRLRRHYLEVVVPAAVENPIRYNERPYDTLSEAYERNVRLSDVGPGNRSAAAYCTKLIKDIENGHGSFAKFDPAAYGKLSRFAN